MQESDQYDYVVINDDSVRAAAEISGLMTPEHN
jgi:guanylate kinase